MHAAVRSVLVDPQYVYTLFLSRRIRHANLFKGILKRHGKPVSLEL